MTLDGHASMLRIYLGESDHVDGAPAYHRIVELLRERGIAGATVLRGIEGFGSKQHIHTSRILSLSLDLPIVIEVVDADERIRAVVPDVERLIGDGLLVILPVEVVAHRSGDASSQRNR
jgi:uncharacterized protein